MNRRRLPRLFAIGVLVVSIEALAASWVPPDKPDVDKTLSDARDLVLSNRDLARAAAMHRWYHEHALTHAPSHTGVRLSFALSNWHVLALRHPPALVDMQTARDLAAERVRAGGPKVREAMHDLASLDMQLGDPRASAAVMAWLGDSRPADARDFAPLALVALVAAGQHELALRHLDLDALLRRTEGHLRTMEAFDARLPEARQVEARRATIDYLDRQVAPALAALVKTDQTLAAQQLFERMQLLLGPEASLQACRDALRGFAPPFRRD